MKGERHEQCHKATDFSRGFSSSFCPASFLKSKLIEEEKEMFTKSKTKV